VINNLACTGQTVLARRAVTYCGSDGNRGSDVTLGTHDAADSTLYPHLKSELSSTKSTFYQGYGKLYPFQITIGQLKIFHSMSK